eukprot:gene778-2533_t
MPQSPFGHVVVYRHDDVQDSGGIDPHCTDWTIYVSVCFFSPPALLHACAVAPAPGPTGDWCSHRAGPGFFGWKSVGSLLHLPCACPLHLVTCTHGHCNKAAPTPLKVSRDHPHPVGRVRARHGGGGGAPADFIAEIKAVFIQVLQQSILCDPLASAKRSIKPADTENVTRSLPPAIALPLPFRLGPSSRGLSHHGPTRTTGPRSPTGWWVMIEAVDDTQ